MWSEWQPVQTDGSQYKHYMLRLEKIDLASSSWWAAPDKALSNLHKVGEFTCKAIVCGSCGIMHKQIFTEGWCCLKRTCPMFFAFADKNINLNDLHYSEEFMNERTKWEGKGPQPLVPSLPQRDGRFGSEAIFKDAIICPGCKYACRRIDWDGWRCEKGCGFTHILKPTQVPLGKFAREVRQLMKTPEEQFDTPDHRVHHIVSHNLPGYEVDAFYLPGSPKNGDDAKIIGNVTVLTPTEATMTRPGGLNDLYKEINKAATEGRIKLQRHAARCRGM